MNRTKPILITGGAGFIGSNFILDWIKSESNPVVNLDKLTYSGNMENLSSLTDNERHIFIHGDIGNRKLVKNIFKRYNPCAVINFAAESHVDRSIKGPAEFIKTNITGTFNLLDETLTYWKGLPASDSESFRFIHISTDEVYGSLGPCEPPFLETTAYAPNSPYAASKAASDHIARAYNHTYGLPVITTNCSNNYGPCQFPEKLIPLVILNAVKDKPLPVYGDGLNIRDWLYVSDHCKAICKVLKYGRTGETYNIGGGSEKTNLEVVKTVCSVLDELKPSPKNIKRSSLIKFVKDRPGHDRRYAIDFRKIEEELGWSPEETFETGIRKTVRWYLDNIKWVENIIDGKYKKWIKDNYGER